MENRRRVHGSLGFIRSTWAVAALAVFLILPYARAEICRSGRFDPSSNGCIEEDIFPFTVAVIELEGGVLPGSVRIVMRGSTIVEVIFDGSCEGQANDDDDPKDGLDEVLMRMKDLSLSGFAARLGVSAGLNLSTAVQNPGEGEIEEKIQLMPGTLDVAPFTVDALAGANAFFDIFFELFLFLPPVGIEDPGVTLNLKNLVPLRVQAMITEKPPFTRFIFDGTPSPIPLVDKDSGVDSGMVITSVVHYTSAVEVDEFFATVAEITFGLPDAGGPELVRLTGPTTVLVPFPGPNLGDIRNDDTGPGSVETEIVAMQLRGSSPTLGEVEVRLNPNFPSLGQIREAVNTLTGRLDVRPFDPTADPADSFFDVFVEVEVPDGTGGTLVLFNDDIDPIRIQTQITSKPPGEGETYKSVAVVPLSIVVDDVVVDSGFTIELVCHTPLPPPISIHGAKYEDLDGDGTKDAEDLPIPDIPFTIEILDYLLFPTFIMTQTNAIPEHEDFGRYWFMDLPANTLPEMIVVA